MSLLDKLAGEFEVTHIRQGEVIKHFKEKNLITEEGKRHILRLAFDVHSSLDISSSTVYLGRSYYNWNNYYPHLLFLGLIGADIIPSPNDTLSTALGTNGTYGEFTAYTASQTDNDNNFRPSLYLRVQDNQSTFASNANNNITFTFTNTTPATIYGFFTTTIRNKRANSNSANTTYAQFHCLFSAIRFSSPIQVVNNDQLIVVYRINL